MPAETAGLSPGGDQTEYLTKQAPEMDMDEGLEENAGSEPYGAQVLRRFHADAAGLLHEIDEMMGLLENPKVKEIAVKVLQWLTSQLDEYESAFKEEFGGLSPLEGAEGEEEEEEEEGLEGGQAETEATKGKPATGRMDKEPTPDEALKGMQRQETGETEEKAMTIEEMKRLYFKRVKALRGHYGQKQYGTLHQQERSKRKHGGGVGNKQKHLNTLTMDILSLRKHLMLLGNRMDPAAKSMRIYALKSIKKKEELKDTLLHGLDKKHRPGSKTEKHGGMDMETGKQKKEVSNS